VPDVRFWWLADFPALGRTGRTTGIGDQHDLANEASVIAPSTTLRSRIVCITIRVDPAHLVSGS